MKLMRAIRNMNAISTFMRNAGANRSTIARVNMAVGVVLGLVVLVVLIFAVVSG